MASLELKSPSSFFSSAQKERVPSMADNLAIVPSPDCTTAISFYGNPCAPVFIASDPAAALNEMLALNEVLGGPPPAALQHNFLEGGQKA